MVIIVRYCYFEQAIYNTRLKIQASSAYLCNSSYIVYVKK
jgi:hypothetical protein